MPNWIEGNIKVRGKEKDVFKFFTNAFNASIERYDKSATVSIQENSYLEGTRRAFASQTFELHFKDCKGEKEVTQVLPIQQAWGFDTDAYEALSRKYVVDIRLIGWEQGTEYKAEVEVLRGHEATYQETTYDDWMWETEMPYLGG